MVTVFKRQAKIWGSQHSDDSVLGEVARYFMLLVTATDFLSVCFPSSPPDSQNRFANSKQFEDEAVRETATPIAFT